MLRSSLFVGNQDLEAAAAGNLRIHAPMQSEAVRLIQAALLSLGVPLPEGGADCIFGPELGEAVRQYKIAWNLQPTDPVVGTKTTLKLDEELAFLEGKIPDLTTVPKGTLLRDPLQVALFDERRGEQTLIQGLLDAFNLGRKFCFRSSFVVEAAGAADVGRLAEKPIFDDYCAGRGGATPQDFLDDAGPAKYVAFLSANNPAADPAKIQALGQKTRPDIISHRAPFEWYEIKPESIAGGAAALLKLGKIVDSYGDAGLPYNVGKSYSPNRRELHLANIVGPSGEQMEAIIEVSRIGPALLFWTLCLKGDFVEYFNRVRLVVGIAAIVAALAVEFLGAAEAGAIVYAMQQLVVSLGAVMPVLQVVR